MNSKKGPWGCWGLGPIAGVEGHQAELLKWRNGVIQAEDSQLRGVWGRWWPYQANLMETWLLQRIRWLPQDHCWVHYSFPRSSPGFLSLRFIHAGKRTRLSTIGIALETLDGIAQIHRAYATVCSVSNTRISESLMKRFGFERHAKQLPGLHFIKRYRAVL